MFRRVTTAVPWPADDSYAGAMTQLVLTPESCIRHDCRGAMDCGADTPGHTLSFLQQRLAAASPRQWRDSVVEQTSADGWLTLRTVDDSLAVLVWNHAGFGDLESGTPVAVHSLYNVLAIGSERLNVVVAAR